MRTILGLLLVLPLAACGGDDVASGAAGVYDLNKEHLLAKRKAEVERDVPEGSPLRKQFMETLSHGMDASEFTITLAGDGTWTFVGTSAGARVEESGTWTESAAGTVVLDTTRANGKAQAQTRTIEIEEGGFLYDLGAGNTMRFVRR